MTFESIAPAFDSKRLSGSVGRRRKADVRLASRREQIHVVFEQKVLNIDVRRRECAARVDFVDAKVFAWRVRNVKRSGAACKRSKRFVLGQRVNLISTRYISSKRKNEIQFSNKSTNKHKQK